MKVVRVSENVRASTEEVLDQLTPEGVVDLIGTYEIESTEEGASGMTVRATGRHLTDDVELKFRRREDGLWYRQVDGKGPYEEMETHIVVANDDEATITIESRFTFGSWLSFVIDILAARTRRKELENLINGLKRDVE